MPVNPFAPAASSPANSVRSFGRPSLRAGVGSILALAPAIAFSHPGHEVADFATGMLHPFTGLDHLLVMLAVGWWAFQLGGRARWMLPTTFLGAQLLGAALGSVTDPAWVEAVVSASVVVLLAAVLLRLRPAMFAAAGLAGGFAVFHGMTHAIEAGPLRVDYLGGLLLSSACLHVTGMLLGVFAGRMQMAHAPR